MTKKNTQSTLSIHEIAPSVAEVILLMTMQARNAPEELKWHYRTAIKLLIRNLERFVKPRVSQAAAETGRKMGLSDLSKFAWRQQPTKMKDKKRKTFHFEHVVQVADLTDAIMALPKPTKRQIAKLLESSQVAWILKTENDRLPKRRRLDPVEAYAKADIKFIE